MARNHVSAYYHVLWSTKDRECLISTDEQRVIMKNQFAIQFSKERCMVYEIGVMEDHIHAVVSIPPSEKISDVIGHVKGASAFAFTRDVSHVKWQEGYGLVTFAKKDLSAVCRYVANQKQHHFDGKYWPSLENAAENT